MFISFANRMSSFFPTESGNDVVLFVCVCVCVCVPSCVLLFVQECVLKRGANRKYSRRPSLYN